MTPDLQGFELDADIGDNGAPDPASAVLGALGRALAVVTEPGPPGSGARQHTWLDTFDWRLNRAGLVLEYEHQNRGGRLLLTRDEVLQAEQPVPGWRSGRPRLAEDLPAGPVRDQILKLASPRALLPMATASGSLSVTRLLNADGKTVARLVVDRSTVTRADQAVPLPPRLAIAEVRGYPGQPRRAARLLAPIPGLPPAHPAASAWEAGRGAGWAHPRAARGPSRACRARRGPREFRRLAAGLRSPRFRALPDHWRKALTEVRDAGRPRKGPTADELAVSRTGRIFRRVAAQGGAITANSAPQSLHDLRKRCKELRYILEFFAPLHDPVAYRKVVGDLKQLQDCLGEFQDSEVQRHEIGALADAMLAERAAPAATLLAMGEIAANLARSQAEARADFTERFTRFAGPAGQQRVRDLLDRPLLSGPRAGAGQ